MLAPPSGRNQDGPMEAVETRILLFDDVEVLDFAGPFEVFSIAETPDHRKAFNVKIVAESKRTVVARNGLKIVPDSSETGRSFCGSGKNHHVRRNLSRN